MRAARAIYPASRAEALEPWRPARIRRMDPTVIGGIGPGFGRIAATPADGAVAPRQCVAGVPGGPEQQSARLHLPGPPSCGSRPCSQAAEQPSAASSARDQAAQRERVAPRGFRGALRAHARRPRQSGRWTRPEPHLFPVPAAERSHCKGVPVSALCATGRAPGLPRRDLAHRRRTIAPRVARSRGINIRRRALAS